MLPTLSRHLRRALHHPFSPLPSPSPMARAMTRAVPLSLRPTIPKFSTARSFSLTPTHFAPNHSPKLSSVLGLREWGVLGGGFGMRVCCVGGGERGYRRGSGRGRGKRRALKSSSKERELELSVSILIEEGLPNDPEILGIAEMLRLNSPMAMKVAFEGLKDSQSKFRDTTIDDVGRFETSELSILLCNDEFIQKLNKEWRDEDHATDVLSMSQHIPELKLPILMLGDIVISVETAARQAEERGHTLLDEIRILLVHGLLHLLGFDHEISEEAEEEMENEEELLLKKLGWKGKGLIKSAYDAGNTGSLHVENPDVCSERNLHDDY